MSHDIPRFPDEPVVGASRVVKLYASKRFHRGSPRENRDTRMTTIQRLTLVGIFLAIFLAALDQTIVSTALPKIVGDLGRTDLYAWVTTAYLLTTSVAGPIFGRLAEIRDPKRIMMIAVACFLTGSFLCGAAPNME